MPKFLHRFTSAERALSVLNDRYLYLAPPSALNDVQEFSGMVDFDCSEDDRKILLDLAARNELGLSEDQVKATRERRDEMAKTEFYVYLLSMRVRGILGYLYEFSGVCCFTQKLDHPLLWGHYADGHRGVCLVFNNLDGNCPIFEDVMPVRYTDERCRLRLLDFYTNRERFKESVIELVHTKQTAWSYEHEWRVVLPSLEPLGDEERRLSFEEQHLCKVILGDRIDPKIRDTIRALESNRQYPLLIYQARVDKQEGCLQYKLIPPDFDYSSNSKWYELPDEASTMPFPFEIINKSA